MAVFKTGRTNIMSKDIEQLLQKQEKLIKVGNELADRALYTTREYDGLHRLASAVAKWIDTVAKLNHEQTSKAKNTTTI